MYRVIKFLADTPRSAGFLGWEPPDFLSSGLANFLSWGHRWSAQFGRGSAPANAKT